MSLTERWRTIAIGLMLAAISATSAIAQEAPPAPPKTGFPVANPAPSGAVPTGNLAPSPGLAAPGVCPQCGRNHPNTHFVRLKSRSSHWHKLQEKFFGYPEEFAPLQLGASVYANGRTQVANGTAARMVLYQYDFIPGTSQLSVRGRDQLWQMAGRLVDTGFPVIVERTTEEPGLDESRRFAVLAELAKGPFPVTSERVVVGRPIAIGVSGVHAEAIDANLLNSISAGGPPVLNPQTGANNSVRATPLGVGR